MRSINEWELCSSVFFYLTEKSLTNESFPVLKILMIVCVGLTEVTKEHTVEPGISPKHRDGLQRDWRWTQCHSHHQAAYAWQGGWQHYWQGQVIPTLWRKWTLQSPFLVHSENIRDKRNDKAACQWKLACVVGLCNFYHDKWFNHSELMT